MGKYSFGKIGGWKRNGNGNEDGSMGLGEWLWESSEELVQTRYGRLRK